jgi:hypothetical protein
MSEWITVLMASRKAGVSDRTIRNWIAKGKIIAKKERSQWLIDPDSLTEIGNDGFQIDGKLERKSDSETLISVSLERYEGLITRLAQLEAENASYRMMLESTEQKQQRQKEPFWRRWLDRRKRNHDNKTS